MKRALDTICSGVLDVLVVGGGIHGAAIGYHAAKAGYRTAVLDKKDFCGATSANSLKILHGGLRYLQHGNIRRMRHSILSRREMMRLAPYLVKPLPCMMPLYGGVLQNRMVMRTALFINDCVGWDRNQGLPVELHLPGGHVVSRQKCREVISNIEDDGLRGAAVWYDVLALDTERLVLEYLLEGESFGVEAANYAAVAAVERENAGNYCVTVEDRLHGQERLVRAKFVVNASGPWFDEQVFASTEQKEPRKQKWALALNLISKKKIFDEYAVALEGQTIYRDSDSLVKRDKRLYFFVPWRDYTMIGTEYSVCPTGPDGMSVKWETIRKMVEEINAICPQAGLQYDDISFFHAGLLPIQNCSEDENIQLEKNSTFAAYDDNGQRGILSLKSVKYTTAPHIAHEVVRYLAKRYQSSKTVMHKDALPTSEGIEDAENEFKGHLQRRYGPRAKRVLQYMDDGKEKNPWIGTGDYLLKAEVEYLIAEEMVCRLGDIVFRRTGLGTAECPSPNLLQDMAEYMGDLLGWDAPAKEKEVQGVLRRYAPLVGRNA